MLCTNPSASHQQAAEAHCVLRRLSTLLRGYPSLNRQATSMLVLLSCTHTSGDPSEVEFSACEVSADGNTVWLGDPLGNLDIVDIRAPSPVMHVAGPGTGHEAASACAQHGHDTGISISERKVNTLCIEPSEGQLLASSSSDGRVMVWDVRALGQALGHSSSASTSSAAAAAGGGHKPGSTHAKTARCKALSVLQHGKSCHAAYWAPDGSKVRRSIRSVKRRRRRRGTHKGCAYRTGGQVWRT